MSEDQSRRVFPWAMALALTLALPLATSGAWAAEPAKPASPTAAPASEAAKGPSVAVLYFDYAGGSEDMSVLRKGLTQMLISDLSVHDGLRLVEREQLEAVLDELELARSKKLDPDTAARIGKLLGARYLVLGSYFELMNTLRVDAKVVEVETGIIVDSAGAQGKPGEFLEVEAAIGRAVGRILLAQADVPPSRVPKVEPKPGSRDKPRSAKAKRPKPPKRLRTSTAVRYAKALDAKDRGDKATAKRELEKVIEEQPDFQLASLDLDRLMQ